MAVLTFARMPTALHDNRALLAARFQELFSAALKEYPAPDHRPDGWADLEASFAERLAAVQPPLDPVQLAPGTAKAVFRTLPVFSENRSGDYRVVYNSVSFGLVAFSDRMRRRVATELAAGALLAGERVDGERTTAVS